MFKRHYSLLLAAMLSTTLLGLSSCQFEVAEDTATAPSLVGYFKSDFGDGFEVSGSATTGYLYTQYDDAEKHISFAGEIVNTPNLEAGTGYLTLRITNTGTWSKTIDYYYVIHWENLSAAGVQASSASLEDWTDPSNSGLAGLADAVATYTVENGYFGYHGEYARQ